MIVGKVPAFDDDARRDVHAQLDAFFAAQRGTLPQARVPEEIAPGKVNVLAGAAVPAYKSSATPQPGKAETSLPRKGGQMSTGSTSQSYATVAPSVGPVDSFARAPLPPSWEYQDEPSANDGVA